MESNIAENDRETMFSLINPDQFITYKAQRGSDYPDYNNAKAVVLYNIGDGYGIGVLHELTTSSGRLMYQCYRGPDGWSNWVSAC